MSKILDELKVILRLEDKATPELKGKTDQLAKSAKEIQGPLQGILNLQNALLGGALATIAKFVLDAADAFTKLGRGLEQASYNFQQTEGTAKNLRLQMMELSRQSIFTTQQLTDGLARITQSGIDATNAFNLLNQAQIFSSATGTDLGTAIDFVNKVMSAFNLTADEAQQALTRVADVSKSTGVEADFLVKAIISLADTAKAGNVSFDDLIQTLASLEGSFKDPAATMAIMQTALQGIAGNTQAIADLKTIAPSLQLAPGKTTVGDVVRQLIQDFNALNAEQKTQRMNELRAVFSQTGKFTLIDAVKELMDLTSNAQQLEKFKNTTEDLRQSFELPPKPIPPAPLSPGEMLGKRGEDVQQGVGLWANMMLTDPLQTLISTWKGNFGMLFSNIGTPGAPIRDLGKDLTTQSNKELDALNKKVQELGQTMALQSDAGKKYLAEQKAYDEAVANAKKQKDLETEAVMEMYRRKQEESQATVTHTDIKKQETKATQDFNETIQNLTYSNMDLAAAARAAAAQAQSAANQAQSAAASASASASSADRTIRNAVKTKTG